MVLKRAKNYPKIFERTYETHYDVNDVEDFVNEISKYSEEYIIIISTISKLK